MNTSQYSTYFQNAYDEMDKATDGKSYKDIELLGNTAATLAANLMQKEENELAYKRSSASNQVNLMRQAGMSRAGAINALNGGGSYTPAPVSAASIGTDAQNVRAQDINMLFSALEAFQSNTAQMAQLQEQKRQFNIQHAEQKRQFDITHAETKRVNDSNINHLVEQGKVLQEQAKKIGFETDILETNKQILNLTKQDYIDAENAENLARKVRSENEKYIEEIRAKGLQHLSPDELKQIIQNVTERQMVETTLEMFGVYLREKGHNAAKKFLQESFIQSLQKGSPLTNAIL